MCLRNACRVERELENYPALRSDGTILDQAMFGSIHPFVLGAGIAAVVGLTCFIGALSLKGWAFRGFLAVVGIFCLLPAAYIFLLLNPWLIDSRFRTYRAFYNDIREGMTREEVLMVMKQHYPQGGAHGVPKIMDDAPESLGFFMNPETSREPNCEGIFLTLKSNRVTAKTYSPD
jgi:hypothetical protein